MPERFASYLMVGGVNQQNIDQVIEFARGGFGCIEIFWERSTPSYEPNPAQFPDGLAGLKAVADKVHAAGMQLGMHVMQGMVGWGSKDDPYITPKADPALAAGPPRDAGRCRWTRTAPRSACAKSTADWPEKGDLYVEGEIVRYEKLTPNGFAQCQRGLHKTTVVAHPEGAPLGHLVNCFPIWGYTVYCPDVKSTMIDEICDRIARVFNEVGADMSYFDGGEEIAVQPPHWRNQGRIALGVQSPAPQARDPGRQRVVHAPVVARDLAGQPQLRPDLLRPPRVHAAVQRPEPGRLGQQPVDRRRGLVRAAHALAGHRRRHARRGRAAVPEGPGRQVAHLVQRRRQQPLGQQADAGDAGDHPHVRRVETPQLLHRGGLRGTPPADGGARAGASGGRRLGPAAAAVRPAARGGRGSPRAVRVDLRESARASNRPGSASAPGRPWRRTDRKAIWCWPTRRPAFRSSRPAPRAAELVQSVEPSAEKSPDGGSTFCYRAENRAQSPSAWCQATLTFPQPLNLTKHRRLGLWIRTEGQGGILNVQLAGTDARRDHYIPLENRGWTYVVLDPPEDDRFFDYAWPYSFTDLMYTCWNVYHEREAVPFVLQRSAAGGQGRLLDRPDRGARGAGPAAGFAGPGGGRPEARLSRFAPARRVPGTGLGRPASATSIPTATCWGKSLRKARCGSPRARIACGSPARSATPLRPGPKSRSRSAGNRWPTPETDPDLR